MNDTMFQETMLNNIAAMDDVVLEAEYETIRSLLDVYIKDAMIQEATVVEADYKLADREAYVSGQAGDTRKKPNIFKRALKFILDLIKKIREKIKAAFNKLKKLGDGKTVLHIDSDVNAIARILSEVNEMITNQRVPKNLAEDFKKRIEKAVKKSIKITDREFFDKVGEIDKLLENCEKGIAKLYELNDEDREMLPDNFAATLAAVSDTLNVVHRVMPEITDSVYKELEAAKAA